MNALNIQREIFSLNVTLFDYLSGFKDPSRGTRLHILHATNVWKITR